MAEFEAQSAPLVLGIGGSLRRGSIAGRALQETLAAVAVQGGEILDYSLKTYPLPLYNDDESDEGAPDVVRALREAARRADALVVASPEYHNSMAGVVKNALDWLQPRDVRDKPFALIGVGGGGAAGHRALVHLRQVVRGLGGFALPGEVSIGNTDAIESDAPWPDGAYERYIQRLARDVVRYALLFRPFRSQERG